MMLEVQGIEAAYGNVQVLKDLSLRVQAGEILCLLGRNGAGKTTILKAIMGLVARKGKLFQLELEQEMNPEKEFRWK